MDYAKARARATELADAQNEAFVVYLVQDTGKHGTAARNYWAVSKDQAKARGHELVSVETIFPMGYSPVIVANGIMEDDPEVRKAALRWIEKVLARTDQSLSDFPDFVYVNADGMEHTLVVDLSGVTDSGYVAGKPHVVFDTTEYLTDLRLLLGGG